MVLTLTLSINAEDKEVDLFKNPESITEFISTFSRLKYNITEIKDEEITIDRWVEYKYEGTEKIQETSTDKISITGSEDVNDMELWVDEDGEIIQIELEHQTMTGEMAKTYGISLTQIILFPFSTYAQIIKPEIIEIIEKKKSQKHEKRQLGGVEVEVIEIDIESWKWSKGEIKSGIMRFGKFKDYLILIGYEFAINKDMEEDEIVNTKFEIESLDLR